MSQKQAIPHSRYEEFIPKIDLRPRTEGVWFLASRDRHGWRLAEKTGFRTEAAAHPPPTPVQPAEPPPDLTVVACRVTLNPVATPCLQFEYETDGEDWTRVQDLRWWSESSLRYRWEFEALTLSGRAAHENVEARDQHVMPVVRLGGRVKLHHSGPGGVAYRWQRDCWDKVLAYLFHQAAEVDMKTLLRTDGWDNDGLKGLDHQLPKVWAAVPERHRNEVNHHANDRGPHGLPDCRQCKPGSHCPVTPPLQPSQVVRG